MSCPKEKLNNIPESRIKIGGNYFNMPIWQRLLALPFVYLPIITSIPFIILGVFLIRIHLKYTGATNLKKYKDFLPAWVSHRYNYHTQITAKKNKVAQVIWKVFWIFNCKMYCPMSVALLRYSSYLVQLIEIWWCPFNHDKKCDYANSAIDKSFWHIYPEALKEMEPEDINNPIWNEDAEKNTEESNK